MLKDFLHLVEHPHLALFHFFQAVGFLPDPEAIDRLHVPPLQKPRRCGAGWLPSWPRALCFRVRGIVGDDIGHVHGKDTTFNPQSIALNGLLDSRWPNPPDQMPWNFATVGRGHDREWWARFVALLLDHGFTGTISIEYEDPFVPVEESVLESAGLLAAVTRG